MAETLSYKQYLLKTDHPIRYTLGPLLRELGLRQAKWNRDVLVPATMAAISLSRRLGTLVRVCQYVADEVFARVWAPSGADTAPRNLHVLPAEAYGAAVMYQAFMTDSQLRDYRAKHPFKNSDHHYWKSPAHLDAVLQLAREEGCLAFVKGSNFRAAAAVYDVTGNVAAIMTVVKRFDETRPGEPRQVIEALKETAGDVTTSVTSSSAS